MKPWERLIPMGLPFGAPRSRSSLSFSSETARKAIEAIADDVGSLDPELREPLLAWLSGFRHHWNPAWQSAIGPTGDKLIQDLSRLPTDPNRFLKLRRIAIENLSSLI